MGVGRVFSAQAVWVAPAQRMLEAVEWWLPPKVAGLRLAY